MAPDMYLKRNSKMPQDFTAITQDSQFPPLLDAISRQDSIALDTEADSQHHYQERLCLIQITADGGHWIIDPLAGLDLAPLFTALAGHELLIHGSDYDLRLLFRTFGFQPDRVFDTMLAAQLIGREAIGLAALVEEFCGVVLDKHGQRADWSLRPIAPDLLVYAADDTRYLHTVAASVHQLLEEKGRLEWHRESCERVMAAAFEPRRDRPEPWRIKGALRIHGRAAALLRELWLWRDEQARLSDRPHFKIVNNDLLLKYAQWIEDKPEAALGEAPELPAWLRGSRRQSFLEALERGFSLGPTHWPARPKIARGERMARIDEDLLKCAIKMRDEVAAGLEISPGVIGARDALKAIIRNHPLTPEAYAECSGLMRWQDGLLADRLLDLIQHPETALAESSETKAPVIESPAEAPAALDPMRPFTREELGIWD